jgi:hypothetical protein
MPASPALHPLPPRPSLEFEHKEAKALLRRLRAGDPDALARVRERHPTLDSSSLTRARLAVAQLVIAREYGFASWPRLVRWFSDVERQQHAHTQLHGGRNSFEASVRRLLAQHRARRPWAARAFAAYVPRFYGLALDDVLANPIEEDDAQLAVARMHGAPSWAVLLERLDGDAGARPGDWAADPMRDVREAMVAADLDALERIVAAHPTLLHPSEYDLSAGHTVMGVALWQERVRGADAMRPIMEWLAARGLDRQRELNASLRGHSSMTPAEVRELLDQGADPNWVTPGGVPVLEHALLRYWNPDAVDLLAERATPRRALWIAAALGDVDRVRGFLDAGGRPTVAARRLRPDFVAAGRPWFVPPLVEADDEEILAETLLVAMLNRRADVLEYLASRGAPVNTLIYGMPLIAMAAGNGMTAAVEGLLRGGADLDLRGEQHSGRAGQSAREIARELFEQRPETDERRRIVELFGMDPDAILAERDARSVPTPRLHPSLEKSLALAHDDAAKLGQSDVRPENLLVGLLREGGPPLYFLKEAGRLDVERFYADLAERLAPPQLDAGREQLPMHADAHAALEMATALAAERRAEEVYGLHLLHALTCVGHGEVAELLSAFGVDPAHVNAQLASAL